MPNSTTRTRPDKVGGLVGDPVSEKVWSGPPSGIWTLLHVSRAGNRHEEQVDGPTSGFRTRKHIGLLLSNQKYPRHELICLRDVQLAEFLWEKQI